MNNTRVFNLTSSPILITDTESYIQAVNGEFLFIFSDEKPSLTECKNAHQDTQFKTQKNFGKLWAWKKYSWKTKLIVSD
ncbi:hypothetical protein [Acinetobacter boissieri]|uniref:Uncharacterized protein n=1 Tax=Acinetobacter boissieri TaxID=1219383 RepID=A0A1G6KGN1_9GAMM|nr:hypothetical protein [Acinetobacter boissieri]SDC30124.1 hypothetical protein SAMN05421733_11815 [Acinetobacter boissieri]